ncbi:P-loop containing nucleoside triphosphate hydrolase protein, partial [Xylariales sp. PMI_506]
MLRSSPTTRLSSRTQSGRKPYQKPSSQGSLGTIQLDLKHAPSNLTPKVAGSHLVNPNEVLPDKLRTIFPYELFNAVQSKCFSSVYGSNNNIVISAPTGSGKTVLLELAICRLVTTLKNEDFKIVYQAPTKSLCSERARDWARKFHHIGLQCVELTGDTSQAETRRVSSASIIVTTPEKWDSITRKWWDHKKLVQMVRLVLIDEVHILKDVRGATLEAVVSRMKTSGANVRLVALSATVPNIGDIANWLGRDHANQQEPAESLSFGEELRPVKLKKYVYGYDGPANDFVFDQSLDGKLNMLLGQHASGKPIIIFCFTRKSCQHTARKLAEWWTSRREDEKPWPGPTQNVPVINNDLQEIVRYGVAFHHAGLDVQDKASVERHYLTGQIHVICCTSTLAVGVNLPCHTVVLKGTVGWTDDGPQEYSDLEVMQMLGRAGRPQFDKGAVAIIMTKRSNIARYERMISGEEVLESKLHLNLIEHLNSEIGLGTIHDLDTAREWIAGTFLYVRMRQAPDHYQAGLPSQEDPLQPTERSPDDRIRAWCERDIELLQKYGLITDQKSFSCTEYGMAMSRYMIQFDTMKMLLSIPRSPTLEQLLAMLSKAAEFRDLRFKPAEKAIFRSMNQSVLYPIKEAITDAWHKIYLCVQIHLGALELPATKEAGHLKRQLALDKSLAFERMKRLIRCVIDCKVSDGDGMGVEVSLELARAIAADSWENHPAQLQQISGIGSVGMRKLCSYDIQSVVNLSRASFTDIDRMMSRNPPFGKNLLKTLEDFPSLTLQVQLVDSPKDYKLNGNTLSVTVQAGLGYNNPKEPIWHNKVPAVTLTVRTTNGNLAYFWRSNLRKIGSSMSTKVRFPVCLGGPNERIVCTYSCEDIVGTAVTKTLSPDISASAFRVISQSIGRGRDKPAKTGGCGYDTDEDLADEDMLTAFDAIPATSQASVPSRADNESEMAGEEFPDIADILAEPPKPSIPVPMRMENGKWMCNHYCHGGGLTKSGKRCSHRCCHEGIDVPR